MKNTVLFAQRACVSVRATFVITVVVAMFVAAVPLAILIMAQEGHSSGKKAPEVNARQYRLSGPFTHDNLTIFLIHGPNQIEGKNFLTLQEALEQKKVVVYETKDVNELAIENRSHEDVYVQAGDIVKGGQQDRVLAVDLIVPPKSGKIPITAFCVEQGRWSRRGEEKVDTFGSSAEVVNTKDLKLAAKKANSQGAVWENVKVAQDKMSQNVGEAVASRTSSSSLQLALENTKLNQTAEAYMQALAKIVKGKSDVIGYVFAINGKVNSADVYASNQLFNKLWPKLLKANATEAIAELQKDQKFEPTSEASVKKFLTDSEQGTGSEKEVTKRVGLLTREDKENVFFETRDRDAKGAWIHRNYIRKE
jgi:hypothetical protein